MKFKFDSGNCSAPMIGMVQNLNFEQCYCSNWKVDIPIYGGFARFCCRFYSVTVRKGILDEVPAEFLSNLTRATAQVAGNGFIPLNTHQFS